MELLAPSRLSTLLSAIIAICLLSTTGCKTDSSSQNLSEAQSVYDSESYLFRAVKKGEDKIGFEVCTIDKKHRRFIAQNQFRVTGCMPAYHAINANGLSTTEVVLTVQDILETFSQEELAITKMLVTELVRNRYEKGKGLSGIIATGAVGVGGAIALSALAAPTLIAMMVGALGTTVIAVGVNEQIAKFKAEVIMEVYVSSTEKQKVMDKLALQLHAHYDYWDDDKLAEMIYHWKAIMSLDPTEGVEVSSVFELQQALGWHLLHRLAEAAVRRGINLANANLPDLFCHPVLSVFGRNKSFRPQIFGPGSYNDYCMKISPEVMGYSGLYTAESLNGTSREEFLNRLKIENEENE